MEMGQIIHGDAFDKLTLLEAESVDVVVTDPPYGYSFMGKNWDKAVPSVELWRRCLRVLKPGAFAFVMSSPRQDVLSQMIVRLGEAGFDMGFTSIYWTYASGFPKAMNISKAVDKRLGLEREVVGTKHHGKPSMTKENGWHDNNMVANSPLTISASDAAKLLDGSYGGFQPKPAVEVILVCMKPLQEKTFVDQALKNGKGVTWLDNARIPFEDGGSIADNPLKRKQKGAKINYGIDANPSAYALKSEVGEMNIDSRGRFPANLLVSDDMLNDGTEHHASCGGGQSSGQTKSQFGIGVGGFKSANQYFDSGAFSRFFSLDAWFEKQFRKLPQEAQRTFPFLITPKASKSERNERLDHRQEQQVNDGRVVPPDNAFQRGRTLRKNIHPTVKPLQLMSYLITLGSRPNDLVLDPFVGSGTTCLAAKMLGRRFVGIEKEAEYVEICRARVDGLKTLFEFEPPQVVACDGGKTKVET